MFNDNLLLEIHILSTCFEKCDKNRHLMLISTKMRTIEVKYLNIFENVSIN
jgi:hypothetical protein